MFKRKFEDSVATKAPKVFPIGSVRPSFKDQQVVTKAGIKWLDGENALILSKDVLQEGTLSTYLNEAVAVERFGGISIFNSSKPRKEIWYTVKGNAVIYSGLSHKTHCYPPHVLQIVPMLYQSVLQHIPDCTFKELSDAGDIIYNKEFEKGGSVGAHSDDVMWGLVVILSLGQTRWLRIRRKSDKEWFNVEMKHNSVVAMYGSTFQQLYTHQVDKLLSSEPVYTRLSLNVRWKVGEDNMEEAIRNSAEFYSR